MVAFVGQGCWGPQGIRAVGRNSTLAQIQCRLFGIAPCCSPPHAPSRQAQGPTSARWLPAGRAEPLNWYKAVISELAGAAPAPAAALSAGHYPGAGYADAKKAAIKGYKAQSEMVVDHLDRWGPWGNLVGYS